MAQQPLVDQGLLIVEDSRSHSGTPHAVGLLWTSDQPDAETFTWKHVILAENRHLCPGGMRTHNPRKQETTDPRLTPRGHRDRLRIISSSKIKWNPAERLHSLDISCNIHTMNLPLSRTFTEPCSIILTGREKNWGDVTTRNQALLGQKNKSVSVIAGNHLVTDIELDLTSQTTESMQ